MTFQEILKIRTDSHEGLYDITARVRAVIEKSGIRTGIASVFARAYLREARRQPCCLPARIKNKYFNVHDRARCISYLLLLINR